jgi:hypothetical protein
MGFSLAKLFCCCKEDDLPVAAVPPCAVRFADEYIPIRPVRGSIPHTSSSFEHQDVYPQRTWHTQKQEDWAGVYGADFDEMKMALKSRGKWEQLKAEGRWKDMAGEMLSEMINREDINLIRKWSELAEQAQKNMKREQTRFEEHGRRTRDDSDYGSNYRSQAATASHLKNMRVIKESRQRAAKFAEKNRAEGIKVRAETRRAEIARMREPAATPRSSSRKVVTRRTV